MKTLFHLLSCVILTVSLGLYGKQTGANTGRADGVVTIVICADAGFETITLDINGNPVHQSPDCCDCVTCNAPAPNLHARFVQPHFHAAQLAAPVFANNNQIPPLVDTSLAQARGPPSMNWHIGARAVPGDGWVCKDTAT